MASLFAPLINSGGFAQVASGGKSQAPTIHYRDGIAFRSSLSSREIQNPDICLTVVVGRPCRSFLFLRCFCAAELMLTCPCTERACGLFCRRNACPDPSLMPWHRFSHAHAGHPRYARSRDMAGDPSAAHFRHHLPQGVLVPKEARGASHCRCGVRVAVCVCARMRCIQSLSCQHVHCATDKHRVVFIHSWLLPPVHSGSERRTNIRSRFKFTCGPLLPICLGSWRQANSHICPHLRSRFSTTPERTDHSHGGPAWVADEVRQQLEQGINPFSNAADPEEEVGGRGTFLLGAGVARFRTGPIVHNRVGF